MGLQYSNEVFWFSSLCRFELFMCLRVFVFLLVACASHDGSPCAAKQPNIVLVYADDVGFGDVSCKGAQAVSTPNIDRIAQEGIRFTDAHCSSATCTPSRYALLTGSYAFRKKNTGIRAGNANLIIEPHSITLPDRLKSVGYATGVVGEWHLGLGKGKMDWNPLVRPGPNEIGFDYHFLIPATGDRVPCVYLEQARVVDLDPSDPIAVDYKRPVGEDPTGRQHPERLKQQLSHGHDKTIVNGISRIGYMSGGKQARWIDEDMADVITSKAIEFVESHRQQPFFLFFSTHDIHVPRVPHSRFVGATSMGPRGDAIAQLDWCVGQRLRTLDRLKLAENTLVIFTSDNGLVLNDGYLDEANEKLGDHRPSGPYRSGKYSKYEGGTRVPFVARWPGEIKAATTANALFGQIDLAATFASLVGADVPEGSLPDSLNHVDALLGKDSVGRPHLIHESNGLALRQGAWKYVTSGKVRDGLNSGAQRKIRNVSLPGELFHLQRDPSEKANLAASEPKQLQMMQALLTKIRQSTDRKLRET